jgi:alkanesulfonate monooxygenase SsuD/methylene tetrahydromethanopterin reductase-like flavin-dependent oxidoreductase (luciferase family)
MRLGTLVATPNFRHPVTLARDVLALDDLSEGRFDLGVGPGSEGPDATALGQSPWSVAERMERFEEFLSILRTILDGGGTTRTTMTGRFYATAEAPSTPGALQTPLPLTVAAGGRRGLDLAARYGQQWVTVGPTGRGPGSPQTVMETVRHQLGLLQVACDANRRDPATLHKVLLWTPVEPVLTSLDQFEELAAPCEALGLDELILHHPQQTGPYGGSLATFEQIAARWKRGATTA